MTETYGYLLITSLTGVSIPNGKAAYRFAKELMSAYELKLLQVPCVGDPASLVR
jgi:hypothetical protein